MRFVYQPSSAGVHAGAPEVAATKPVVNALGELLIAPRLVAADDSAAWRVFRAEEIIDIDEAAEPALARFLSLEKQHFKKPPSYSDRE
jgi:hypothetical protein